MAQKIRYILLQLFMSAVFIAFGTAIEKNGNLPSGFGMIYAAIPGCILLFNILMNFISFKKAVVFPIVCLVICLVADIVATVIYKVKYPDFVSMLVVILSVLLTVLHHLTVFALDAWSWSQWWWVLLEVVVSGAVTIGVLFVYGFLIHRS